MGTRKTRGGTATPGFVVNLRPELFRKAWGQAPPPGMCPATHNVAAPVREMKTTLHLHSPFGGGGAYKDTF